MYSGPTHPKIAFVTQSQRPSNGCVLILLPLLTRLFIRPQKTQRPKINRHWRLYLAGPRHRLIDISLQPFPSTIRPERHKLDLRSLRTILYEVQTLVLCGEEGDENGKEVGEVEAVGFEDAGDAREGY